MVRKKGNPCALLVRMQIVAATVESRKEIPQKLKIDLSFDPVIPLRGIYPKKLQTLMCKNTYTCMFIAALFTIAKIWKQPKCPLVDEWMVNMWYIYRMECY